MPLLTDTHCHLDIDRYDEDRAAVIQRAKEQGLTRILIPALDVASSREIVKLAEQEEMIYAAVGVHPNSGTSWTANSLAELRELAVHPKVVAIGEIGLDFYREWTPQPLQRKIFREQLMLAAEMELPVVIHDREAHSEIIPVLVDWQEGLDAEDLALAEKPGVLHSYSGTLNQAEAVLAAGYYLGVTGPVTFKNAIEMQEVAQRAPLERLLIETDGPYLTPHPFRGQRNEPGYVRFVAEKMAELRGMTINEIGRITTENSGRLFGW